MATGVLVLGIGRATRLLGHLALTDKAYDATVRLGVSTRTDDADGDVVATHDASDVSEKAVRAEVAALTGDLLQVPSAVSAIKVDGRRAYARVRAGEDVELAPRPVTVHTFEVLGLHRDVGVLDVDVRVTCSSGTYVRALARDLGSALGVGGHLTRLRRTRVGPYDLSFAHTLDDLEKQFQLLPIADAAAAAFARVDVDSETAARLVHGAPMPPTGAPGLVAVFGPGPVFLALVEDRGPRAKPIAVFAAAQDVG